MRRWASLISIVAVTVTAWVAGGQAHGAARVRDLAGHTAMVRDLSVSPDGARLASVANDHTVRLWDLASGKTLQQWDTDNYFVALSPDGRLIALGKGDGVDVVEIATGSRLRHFAMASVSAVAFSPDGKQLATAGYGENYVIALWNLQDGKRLANLKGNRNTVQSLVFSRGGDRLLSSSSDNSVRVFAIPDGAPKAAIRLRVGMGGVDQASLAPDGQTIVAGSWSAKLWIFDARESGTLHEIKTSASGDHTSAALSPDGTLIASATGVGSLRFWRLSGDEIVGKPIDARGGVNAIRFSPDGTWLAYAGDGDFAIHIRSAPVAR